MSLQSLYQLAEPGQSTGHLQPDLAARSEDFWGSLKLRPSMILTVDCLVGHIRASFL